MKLLRAQGQNELAISLAKYISQNTTSNETISDVHRLIGKWLGETRSSRLFRCACIWRIYISKCFHPYFSFLHNSSRTILESYLKPAVALAEDLRVTDKKSIDRQSQTHFQLAHYADGLFRSYEDRLTSSEWEAATRLRKHKVFPLMIPWDEWLSITVVNFSFMLIVQTMELEALIKRLKSSTKVGSFSYH